MTRIIGNVRVARRSDSLLRGTFTGDMAQLIDGTALKICGDEERDSCGLLHSLIERGELAARLGIAVTILDQYPADPVALNHLVEVCSKCRTVEFDNDHLSQLLIQPHILHTFHGHV